MESYETLGAFYLGREVDPGARGAAPRTSPPLLYDARDLTTHAVIIGMTGSGKTGLGIGLLEEALIDRIPVIAVDPKGDLPNLLLQFPALAPEDFRPWVDPQEALAKGVAPEALAAQQAERWRKGLAEWDQPPERIARLAAAADFAVYTPGSLAGRPVSVLRSFAAPPDGARQDPDLLRERIASTATSLLALMGIAADPVTSREHILLANIFEKSWAAGRSLDLAGLIQAVQKPPLARVGVMELELFYPAQERFALAMRLNSLLAAPGFGAWLEGTPLDIGALLWTPEGRPRASIFTLAHLSESERMFFVAMLLGEILAWVRSQPGTASLRALLYLDEVFGFLPPVANPPSKGPLLSLLKQARAFGLGVVLATQNPVDLDYKGLSNAGTWFIGRLQTERDKERVLEGLEGAAAGRRFDRPAIDRALSGLGNRTFWLHNVHEEGPAVFQTRWTLSYLAGPMGREGLARLAALRPSAGPPPLPSPSGAAAGSASSSAPVLQPGVASFVLPASGAGQQLLYLPAAAGELEIHYASGRHGVSLSRTFALAAPLEEGMAAPDWGAAEPLPPGSLDPQAAPLPGAQFSPIPAAAATSLRVWEKELVRWARLNRPLVLYRSGRLDQVSRPGEAEGAFRARLTQGLREKRDLEAEKLRRKYAERFVSLQGRLMRAEQAVARQSEEARARRVDTAISFGTAILGAFLGRKAISATSATRVGGAVRTAGRLQKEQMDVARAQESAEAVRAEIAEMEARLQGEIAALGTAFDPAAEPLEEIRVAAKAQDIVLRRFGLAWLPCRREPDGRTIPDWPRSEAQPA